MAQQITIDIVAETQKLRQGVDDVNSKLGGIQKTADNINKVTGAVVGVGVAARGLSAVGGFIGGATDAASEMEQQFGGLDAVFESNGERLKQFSLEASSLGIAASDAARSAVLIGSQFKATGFDIDTVSDQTEGLLNLSADLAAQFGGTSTDAIEALGSAFRGEFNPIERYGVSLRKSDINARLAAKGQAQLTGDALKQAEIMATLELITERTADAQGAAAREADTYASQQQQMNAELENAKAELGQAFLPLMVELTKILRIAVDAFTSLPKGVQQGILIFGLFAATLGPLILLVSSLISAFSVIGPIIKGFSIATKVAAAAQALFNGVLAINPIFLVVAALAALVAGLIYFFTQTELGRKLWDKFTKFVVKTAGQIKDFIVNAFKKIGQFIEETVDNIGKFIESVWNGIKRVTETIFNGIRAYFEFVFNVYKTIFTTVLSVIQTIVTTAWDFIKNATQVAFDKVKEIIKNIWNGIKDYFSELISRIINVFQTLPGEMLNIGRNIIEGIWNGISGAFNWFKNKILGFFGRILPGWVKNALGISSPSKLFEAIGVDVTDGLVKGLSLDSLRYIGDSIATSLTPTIDTPTLRPSAMSSGQPINVTINAGLGTNPLELGRQVNSALTRYGSVSRRV